jgi:tight adherence protein B
MGVIVFTALALAGIAYYSFGRLFASNDEVEEEEAEERRMAVRRFIDRALETVTRPAIGGQRKSKLQADLDAASITLRAHEFIAVQIATFVAVEVLLYLRFQNPLVSLLGALLGYFIPVMYLRHRQRRRRQQIDSLLAETLRMMSNGLKAGFSVQRSIENVAVNGRQPMAAEFERMATELRYGYDVNEALEHARTRLDSRDFDIFATAIAVHRVSGGNLAATLDTLSETIRERVRIKNEVRILTAQARGSAYIVTALPFIAVGAIGYFRPEFMKPLFDTLLGLILVAIGLAMIAVGFGIIRRITDIEL